MKPIKTIDIELSRPFEPVRDLNGYLNARALLRWRGQPIETVTIPISNGECSANDLNSALTSEVTEKVLASVLRSHLPTLGSGPLTLNRMLSEAPPQHGNCRSPSISVAVCTRDRPDDLRLCLIALSDLDEPPLEIIVVDNAPRTDATRKVVESFQHSPMSARTRFRYILEDKPGLDWARNRAIEEACGEIVAFTDDDVVVDPGWTRALAKNFAENPDTMAVTGLVVPYELQTEAQYWFEELGGFGRGYNRCWYHTAVGDRIAFRHGGAGKFGTGANMAFRRCLFEKIGAFDPALDVGTCTRGGGDLEMFFRVLKTGHTLVYDPSAMVRHRHRISYGALYNQIRNNGIGFFSYVTRCWRIYPEERLQLLKLSWLFLWWWDVRRWVWSALRAGIVPTELYRAELTGSFVGLFQYARSCQKAAQLGGSDNQNRRTQKPQASTNLVTRREGIAVRTIDLNEGLRDFADVSEYRVARIYVLWQGTPLGFVEVENRFHPVSAAEIGDLIVQRLAVPLLQAQQQLGAVDVVAEFDKTFRRFLGVDAAPKIEAVMPPVRVSIVVATYDRPEDLRLCLRSLCAQQTRHDVEIVVVDNHPQSGLTPKVVAEFREVKLVAERRGGLSFARNTGFRACTGAIAVATDDDVTMPSDWIEKLIEPFAQSDVMIVTGAVFPAELETQSQINFETYGGLGRGFERRRFDRDWFDSFGRRAVKTWEIGATANAAVRMTALMDSNIGFLDEALGAGTPTGCGEDTYLFYRVLKAGYAICYEPAAFVWHRHRRDGKALSRQLYNYAKGHAAYHVVTYMRDGDRRALTRLFAEMPIYFFQCLRSWFWRRRPYPLSLIIAEMCGHIAGPFALWKARRRVARLDRQQIEINETGTILRSAPVPVEI